MFTLLYSGPHDIELTGADMPVLHVDKLHVDESVGSPSLYQFQLCVVDYHNLTDIANVTIAYYKSKTACAGNSICGSLR